MTDTVGHIICGGLGWLLGWIRIWIKDHAFLNVAVNLKHEALIAEGWTPQEAKKFGEMIQKDVHRWYEIGKKKGLEAHYYQPYHGNVHQVPVPEPVE